MSNASFHSTTRIESRDRDARARWRVERVVSESRLGFRAEQKVAAMPPPDERFSPAVDQMPP
jgi:hypothetical protein